MPHRAHHGLARERGSSPRGEATLVAQLGAIARGDGGALDDFFAATGALVLDLARRILHDVHEAEEAMLDVYRYVWERARNYDESRGSVQAWLMTIARSRTLDRARARRSRAAHQADSLELADEAVVDPAFGPPEILLDAERDDALDRALRSLTEKERRVIDLAFFRGKSHTEIAQVTGEPLGTIKSQIRRGLMKLHRLVENLESDR